MGKQGLIFCSVVILAMLIAPMTVAPTAQAITLNGPVPIPAGVIPIPNSSGVSPIVPSLPNLGTVSIEPPPLPLYSISQSKSGLVTSDSLTDKTMTQQQLQTSSTYWIFGGSATVLNAPYEFFENSQGLHIGVKAPANGTWAGFYAVTPNTNARLFHAVITNPVNAIPYQWYNNGLYVQTSQPLINYVTCAVQAGAWGTNWAVVSTTGDANQATAFNLLWVDTSPNQPLTRDCTIITNGNNYLKVYLDGVPVYSNDTLNLQMPAPFNAYLEPQSSYPAQMLDGTYKDYYTTTSEFVKVTNNPILAATVKLVDPSGIVRASQPVDSSGTATLDIGEFHFPLAAYIKIYDSLGNQLASTSSPVNMFGGDVYSVNTLSLQLGPVGISLP